MNHSIIRRFSFALLCATLSLSTVAQTTAFGDNLNVVTSAMPMLTIGPDARAGGMGREREQDY